jgi:hypothetical protein
MWLLPLQFHLLSKAPFAWKAKLKPSTHYLASQSLGFMPFPYPNRRGYLQLSASSASFAYAALLVMGFFLTRHL